MLLRNALLVLGSAVALAACGPDDAPTGVRPTDPFGRIRLVNATPDPARGGPVNVWFDGRPTVPLTANLAYGAATAYAPIYVGSHTVNVRKTADTTVAVLDAQVTIEEGVDYSVLATGTGTDLTPLILTDANTAPAGDSVKIRVVHASPSAGNVDVYVTPVAVADITPLAPTLADVPFRTASSYFTLPVGQYRVRFTAPGRKMVSLEATVNVPAAGTNPARNLPAGAVRTVLALDKAGGGVPLIASVLTDR